MDLTFQVPIQSCSLQHGTYFHHQSHPQLGVVFTLALSLCSFWSYFSTLLQKHIGHLPTWGVHLSVSYLFALSYCSCGSQSKNIEVVCHSLLQWTMFGQNSPPWPVHFGWAYMAWLIVSLNQTRLWSVWSVWLVSCDCDFHSAYLLMDKDKRLLEASWWETLTGGKTWPYSDVQGHTQQIFNPIFCWWVGLCSLPVVWPEAKLWWR